MRVVSFIMTFVVLYLSVQPALAMMEEKQIPVNCCAGCHPQEEEPKTESCNHSCNPFQSCSFCGGYIISSQTLSFSAPFVKGPALISFTQQLYSQFSHDVWEPPKI